MKLTHLDERGRARMVDVGGKPESERTAVAEGAVRMSREAFDLVAAQAVAKGDVLAVAEVAGTMGAKRTGDLIPLCHPARSGPGRGRGAAGAGAAGRKDHRGGQGDRPNRSRDGGAHRGRGRLSHGVRHGESSRSRNDDRGSTAGQQDRGNPGRLAPVRVVERNGLLTMERGLRVSRPKYYDDPKPMTAERLLLRGGVAPGRCCGHRCARRLEQARPGHRSTCRCPFRMSGPWRGRWEA